jgi:MtrB/PioB family decaheme-associated outer membrane protein
MHTLPRHFQRTTVALAVGLALSSHAFAEENEEVANLITPSSFISAGVGYVGNQGGHSGMYNGLYRDGTVGLLDFSYVRREEETGTWLRASGRNLGLNTRELRAEYERQGVWGVFVDYNEISRVSPYMVTSNVQGIGTAYQTVPTVAAATNQFTLKTERYRTSVGFNAALGTNTEFRLLFQNEDKEGSRLFGRGTTNAMEFLAEPINSNTKQFDLVLDYTGDKLQLSGGYYGSFFNNHNSALRVSGGAASLSSISVATPGVAMDNIALPPDNYAHQFHLAGGYQFAKTTRMSFKVARSVAVQNDQFMDVRFSNNVLSNAASANTSGRTDLGGRVTTTLANLGLTSRPTRNLFLLGNVRYEERDDQTAIARYITNVTGANAAAPTITPYNPNGAAADRRQSTDGFNEPRSLKNWGGKLEASYSLPDGYRVTGGYDYDNKERSVTGVRVVGYRNKVEESTYRLELKRAMSESVSGSVAYAYSERRGSNYYNLSTLGGITYPNYGTADSTNCATTAGLNVTHCGLIQPIYMADRDRQKVRLLTDWSPTDELSLQFAVEGAVDEYSAGRGTPNIGVRHGDSWLYSVDASYQASDRWRFNAWLSHTDSSIDQASIASITAMSNVGAIVWNSSQRNSVDALGIGTRGKLPKGIEVGADLIFSYDRTRYNMGKDGYAAFSNTAVPSGLPDIKYEQQTLRLFGTYPVDKNLTARLDYILDRRKVNDWTWDNWTYTDGTRITLNPVTQAYLIGLSFNFAFR